LPIEGMVRGHDHVNERMERWERKTTVQRSSYEGRILTINALSFNQRREPGSHNPPNPRAPVLARWRLGQGLPTPVVVALPSDLVSWYAPTCPNCRQPNATGATTCTMVRPANGGERVCGVPLRADGQVQ
jgi:hypothetical protein